MLNSRSSNLHKLLFLIVLIAVVFFAKLAYPGAGSGSGTTTTANTSAQNQAANGNPPLLALSAEAAPAIVVQQAAENSTEPQAAIGQTAGSPFIKFGTSVLPILSDTAYLVADPNGSAVFAALNPDKRWPTASLTKLMAATVIMDHLDLTTRITITPEMFAADPQEATLVVGGTYTVSDLLHVMLMPSSNVAVEAMADFYGRINFLNEMNQRAVAWGMKNTYFDDPSGISAANQSTASDMLILASHVLSSYPQILAITRTADTSITELNSNKKVDVKSINNFAGTPGFLGGKTGHTNEASGNLLSFFQYNNHPVLVIVLGTDNRFNDTQKLYDWFKANYK